MAPTPTNGDVDVKILHLFSNHKFTGPADPALVAAGALCAAGHEVVFAAGRSPQDGSSGVGELARERGLTTDDRLTLLKHGRPWPLLRDVHRLRDWLRTGAFDAVHCHLPNDHLIGALASRGSGVPVVRTLYEPDVDRGWRSRSAWRRTGGAVVFADRAAESVSRLERSVAVARLDPPLDLARFGGERHGDPSLRASWGVERDDFVVGVVARMQPHRRFPELIAGFVAAAQSTPRLHLVVLGRGTHQERVAKEPARRSSAPDRIHFPGYVDPERYPQCLLEFDALIFLVPGSDGTCRAAREALASGVPIIASSRGLLPDLIEDGRTGLVLADDTPSAIAEAVTRLATENETQQALSVEARRRAIERFDAEQHAARLIELYRTIEPR